MLSSVRALRPLKLLNVHSSIPRVGRVVGSFQSCQTRAFSRTSLSAIKTAIVGMPNVGKSTLFNALTETQGALAANYPFATIEPNVGIVEVPDSRLPVMAVINKSVKTIPASLEFVDVAGLVKGASDGEGLGNKFLANIRECDAIVHVVRCFEDENVIHVDGTVDPLRDADVINLELVLADGAQVDKRLERVRKDKNKDEHELNALEKLKVALDEGKPARSVDLEEEEELSVKSLGLLTRKKMIYAANVADGDLAEGNDMVSSLRNIAAEEGANLVVVSAQVESELCELPEDDRADFLEALGVTLENSGLRALVSSAYELLGLRTYYTSGPTETRAWTIKAGWKAPQAAGVIHNDFERGFIRAETMSYDDLVKEGDEQAVKAAGLMRSEGKEYEVKEGDIMLFRFNV
ncbi:hypothetical protein TrLO_g9410 [Triparma laevis f. longispina]|uniref:Obg-like ATPase 1 n=2 Tax=Triparma laevis TaxID=1534972 RepID=A0A9W7AFW8_9STRA|nr:hypothetical protein TrLO_g9410 [Triparma laevis f. longispina]